VETSGEEGETCTNASASSCGGHRGAASVAGVSGRCLRPFTGRRGVGVHVRCPQLRPQSAGDPTGGASAHLEQRYTRVARPLGHPDLAGAALRPRRERRGHVFLVLGVHCAVIRVLAPPGRVHAERHARRHRGIGCGAEFPNNFLTIGAPRGQPKIALARCAPRRTGPLQGLRTTPDSVDGRAGAADLHPGRR
jgi:hypothetical protein